AAVVLAVAGGVVWGVTRDSAPVAEATPYVDPGPFSAKPDVRELLTAEQLGRLGVKTKPNGTNKDSIWGTANDSDPGNLKRQLSLKEELYPSAARASEVLARNVATAAKKRTNQYGSPQTPLRPVSGLGNEAVVGEVSGGSYSVTVIVRVNNLLLRVQYQNTRGPADEEIMRNALTAAGWAVGSLTRGR
ncbi:hypothetical protein ACFQ08_38845, partial [Streptosporangium algeriense]